VNNEQSSNAEVVAAMVGPTTEAGPELAPVPAQAEIPAASSVPIVVRAWQRLRSEPSLLITTAYLFVSFIGLWANYWFYRDFGLPILEYMQASDYLVAGLRDPAYALILLGSILLTLLISGPDVYRHRHPQRVDALRTKWWGRVVFPASRWLRWKAVGLAPETGVAFALFWGMMWATVSYVQDKGRYIREDRAGNLVQVTMAGDQSPLPHAARLLGSSGAFVFLWRPQARVAEAVPIESIARLQATPLLQAKSAPAKSSGPLPQPAAVPVTEANKAAAN
jgi:hypothetical protein